MTKPVIHSAVFVEIMKLSDEITNGDLLERFDVCDSMPYTKDFQSGNWVDSADFIEAVSAGVREAIWGIATDATDAPCADFYEAIKSGAESAVKSMHK